MARKTLRASEQSCPFQNAICASLRQRQVRTQQRFAIARNPYDLQRQAESVVHHPSRVQCPNANCRTLLPTSWRPETHQNPETTDANCSLWNHVWYCLRRHWRGRQNPIGVNLTRNPSTQCQHTVILEHCGNKVRRRSKAWGRTKYPKFFTVAVL